MARTFKKAFIVAALLIGGATLGMQLAGPDTPNENPAGVGYVVQSPAGLQTDAEKIVVPSGYVLVPLNQGEQTPKPIYIQQTPAQILLPPPSSPAVDQFADKTGHLLQKLSNNTINWIASLFD